MAKLPLRTQLNPIPTPTSWEDVRKSLEAVVEQLTSRIDEMVSFYNDTIVNFNTTDDPQPATPAIDEVLAYNRANGFASLGVDGVWIPLISHPAVIRTVTTTPVTLTATDGIVFVDCTSGNRTINLPTAVGIAGRGYWIWKIDASANTVTVDAAGTETISGSGSSGLTLTISSQWENHYVLSTGANWVDWI